MCIGITLPLLRSLPQDSVFPKTILVAICIGCPRSRARACGRLIHSPDRIRSNIGGYITPNSSPQNAVGIQVLADNKQVSLRPPRAASRAHMCTDGSRRTLAT
jgi:hypothetical protein